LSDDVLFSVENGLGRVSLNRPKTLNALTEEMCVAMSAQLARWECDPAIVAVMIDHASPRGFCAGGDVRRVAENVARDPAVAGRFFTAEYGLNVRIKRFSKPYLAVLDGITMGGGAGISVHGTYRLATERTVFAMPETALGFFPDVGGGWFLPRAPGRVGEWLALTGARLNGADCIDAAIATHYVSSGRVDAVKAAVIAAPAELPDILNDAHEDPGHGPVAAHREAIDRLFRPERVEGIFAALATDSSDWAREQLAILRTRSPRALKVTLRQLKKAATIGNFRELMRMEYRLAVRVARMHDFYEGVRAVLIDKDNAARWSPTTLEGVDDAEIEALFAPLPDGEELNV
jgi:enoyl-CoA hydratase